jgi:glyoxylate/hydroxypyruvate reductase A
MTINILFAGSQADWPVYKVELTKALVNQGVDARLCDTMNPEDVDYIIYAPDGPLTDFSRYMRCKAVLGLWAGVERIVSNPTLRQPLARMVDAGLREGMVEWVTGHVLRYHLGMDQHILNQDGVWRDKTAAPLARSRTVGILGLGALGAACAQALVQLNFNVVGWSRRPKDIDRIECMWGESGLHDVIRQSDILVLLLPDTRTTTNTLDAEALALLPKGARIINPGRGTLIDDEALLDALNAGQVGHATLDVFREEPLPINHPFWAHPNVTVTPHIASSTRPDTVSDFVAENISRYERGLSLIGLVDRSVGY